MSADNKTLMTKIDGSGNAAASWVNHLATKGRELSLTLATLAGEAPIKGKDGLTETAKKMLSGIKYAAMKIPELKECSIETLGNCMLQSAVTGLYPGALEECYYLPFKTKRGMEAQFIPDYRGLVKLAYQSSFVKDINYGAVFEGDLFDYAKGTDPFIKHQSLVDEDPEKLTHAYCVVRLTSGGCVFEVITRKQIEGTRRQSRSGNSEYSPWAKFYSTMAIKTAIKRALKTIPKSAKLEKVLAHDTVVESEDPTAAQIIDAELIKEGE